MAREGVRAVGHQSFPDLGLAAAWIGPDGRAAEDWICWNETRDVALLFCGECFAAPADRAELARKGHATGTGTGGWLVHLYEELGDRFFASLNGLFSGLVVDLRQGRACLFNDRYGIERLYLAESDGSVYFASEAKALLRVLPATRAFDERGVAQFLQYGCTLNGDTLFRGIRLAPGAALWTIEKGRCRSARYFTPEQWETLPVLREDEFQSRFSETFPRILPRYLKADGCLGISLTGGLDTRMIMACLPPRAVPAVCYTFAGLNPALRDAQVAAQVARACGLRHEILPIRSDFFREFGALADETVRGTDGCFGVLGAHEIYLNAQASRISPVRLTGNFGGELLRGVSTFRRVGLAPDLVAVDLLRAHAPDQAGPWDAGEHPVRFAAFKEVPWHLYGSLCAGRTRVTFRTPYLDNEIVALAFQSPPAVRSSAASALRFVAGKSPALARIPTDRGEGARGLPLRRLAAAAAFKLDYYCSEGLPRGLTALDPLYQWCNARLGLQGRHKYLTYRNWLKGELAELAAERLSAAGDASLPLVNAATVRRLAGDHVSGRRNCTREINAVLTLEAVKRLLLRAPSPG